MPNFREVKKSLVLGPVEVQVKQFSQSKSKKKPRTIMLKFVKIKVGD